MKLIVKARHMRLTQALRLYAEKKLARPWARLAGQAGTRIEIELSEPGPLAEGKLHECRISACIPQQSAIVVRQTHANMYKAIDLAHDLLVREIHRHRDKSRYGCSRDRKTARKARARLAEHNLKQSPKGPKAWQRELAAFEYSQRNFHSCAWG